MNSFINEIISLSLALAQLFGTIGGVLIIFSKAIFPDSIFLKKWMKFSFWLFFAFAVYPFIVKAVQDYFVHSFSDPKTAEYISFTANFIITYLFLIHFPSKLFFKSKRSSTEKRETILGNPVSIIVKSLYEKLLMGLFLYFCYHVAGFFGFLNTPWLQDFMKIIKKFS